MNIKDSAGMGGATESENGQGAASGLTESDHQLLLLQSCVLNSMQEAVAILDGAGYIQYTNTAQDRLFGYGPGELTGQNVAALNAYPPDETARRVADVTACLEHGGQWQGEWLNFRKSGDRMHTFGRVTEIAISGRKFKVCVQSAINNDRRRELEDSQLAAIVESSDDAIITKDLNGVITSWNRGAERIFGYSAEEAIGAPVAMLAAPHRMNEMPDILTRLKNGGLIDHYETERRTKDGRIISVSLTVSPLRDNKGAVIGASKIARDITESKRVRSEMAARELEYCNLLANVPDTITRFDRDLRITFMSEAVRGFDGMSAEHYIGKTHAEAGVDAETTRLFEAELRKIISKGQRSAIEFEHPNPAGEMRHYMSIGVPERSGSEVVGVLTITRDVTEQKQARNAQQAIERELMLLVEASSALIASPQSPNVLRTILDLARRFISADAYAVWRQKGGNWSVVSSAGLSDNYVRQSSQDQPSGNAMVETMMCEDVYTHPLLSFRRAFYEGEGIRSMLVTPLLIHGRFSGTVVYYWQQPRRGSEAEIRIASALGNLAAGALGTADLIEDETRSRLRAERSERRSQFLAEAGTLLSSSLDFNATLNNVAKLAVPVFADWCSADVVNERGEPERVAVYHWDPNMLMLAEDLRRKYPPREDDANRVAIRTGKSFLTPEISEEMLLRGARSAEHLEMLRKLNLRSVMIAPMMVGADCLGVITFVSSESGRLYDERDLEIAEELARRAGTAISHARLYAHVRESEERLRIAITAAKLGVWENDRASGVLACSDQWKRNMGLSLEDDVTQEALEQRIHPEDREGWRRAVEEAIGKRIPFEVDYRVQSPDGATKWVLSYGQGIYRPNGEVQKTVGVTMDVTENRSLLLREREARRTAELLNGLGPVLLAELDPWRLVHSVIELAAELVNAQYAILFCRFDGTDSHPLLYSFSGISRSVFDSLPAAERDRLTTVWSGYQSFLRTDGPDQAASPFAGLTGRVQSLMAAPVRSRTGQVLGALFFGHAAPGVFQSGDEDVVKGIAAQASIALENAHLFERARTTEEALRRSNEELRRANEDLNQFAYSASHDLQEPLRMVAIYSQMLGRRYDGALDEKGREYLRFTVQGAKRMEMLVKDLLAYTQAGAAAGEEAEEIQGAPILKQALLNLQGSIEENDAVVAYDVLPSLRVQEVHLLQLLQNLIGNAIKYRRSDVPPRIEVRHAKRDGGMTQLSVHDNGIGIPAQYQKQVFGLFKRLHSGEKYAGTGIGLAICQRIVERYGGRIWLESEEGVGSTFFFSLPAGDRPVDG